MKFTIKDSMTTRNHMVIVEAYYDGSKTPIARARLSGFGDALHRDISFDKKGLEDGIKAIEGAEGLVDKLQAIADKWYEEIKNA